MTHYSYSPLLGEMICDAERLPTASPQSVGVADQLQALAAELDGICDQMSYQIESTDRTIGAVDLAIQRTHRLGLCHRQVTLGPVAFRRLYGPDGPPECLELMQAAVTSDFGCTALAWSSDDYQEWQEEGEPHQAAFERCVPLRDCSPAVRVALLRHIPDLLCTLLRGVERSLMVD